jgi:putative transposase
MFDLMVRGGTPGELLASTSTGLDSTPINVLVLFSDGKAGRGHLTVAMDIATRSILAFDIVPVGATGVEHADLLARMLRPRQCRPDAPDYMRLDKAGDLPAAAMLSADERQRGAVAVPYIVPETITTDRGKDYLSDTFVSACRHFGIGV